MLCSLLLLIYVILLLAMESGARAVGTRNISMRSQRKIYVLWVWFTILAE